jgi:hypothetical protein
MPKPDRPIVRVIDGLPAVDPEPLRFARSERNVTIIWRLEDASDYLFTDDGIRIDGEELPDGVMRNQSEIVDGKRTAGGRQFVWLNRNSRPGKYKYTVRLQSRDGRVIEKDPSIINGADL